MPSHYPYQCTECGKVETRYRNARRSHCCHAEVVRLEPKPIDWEGHVANLQVEVDRLRGLLSKADMLIEDLDASPHPDSKPCPVCEGRGWVDWLE